MPRTKTSARARQMHTLIRKYLSSGLTQKQFYEQEKLPRSTFLYWLGHYRKNNKPGPSASFIPLAVRETSKATASGCSISFPGDIAIHFESRPQIELLLKLINAKGA